MSLNSLTYPLQYEDLRPNTDPEITLDIDGIEEPVNPEAGFEGIIGKKFGSSPRAADGRNRRLGRFDGAVAG